VAPRDIAETTANKGCGSCRGARFEPNHPQISRTRLTITINRFRRRRPRVSPRRARLRPITRHLSRRVIRIVRFRIPGRAARIVPALSAQRKLYLLRHHCPRRMIRIHLCHRRRSPRASAGCGSVKFKPGSTFQLTRSAGSRIVESMRSQTARIATF
jgi:hypothetical protein